MKFEICSIVEYRATVTILHIAIRYIYAFKTMTPEETKLRMQRTASGVTIFNPGGRGNARIMRADITAKNGLMNIVDQGR